jgi:hypothetical protein
MMANPSYGYGEATPYAPASQAEQTGVAQPLSSDEKEKYGYEDVFPNKRTSTSSYSQEDALFDERTKYRYGDATPYSNDCRFSQQDRFDGGRSSLTSLVRAGGHTTTPRRSSMKQSGRPRRASIQFGRTGEIEVALPQGKVLKRRTSITFNDPNDVCRVAPAVELADDPESLYLRRADLRRMKQSISEKVVDGGSMMIRWKHCTRGLERYMGSNKEVISEQRSEARLTTKRCLSTSRWKRICCSPDF